MATFTDPALVAGTTKIRATHITEARSTYKAVEAYTKFPGVSVTFTDPTLTAGTSKIRVVHMNELRAAINALETKFSGNCANCNCANCCQTQCATTSDCQCNCNCSCGDCG